MSTGQRTAGRSTEGRTGAPSDGTSCAPAAPNENGRAGAASVRGSASVAETALTAAEQAVAAGLAPFRARLDDIDAELVDLLGERFQICREVAVHKAERGIEMMQPGRVQIVRARYLQHGAEVDLPADFTGTFFDLLIDATCRAEDELMERLTAGERGTSAFTPAQEGRMQTRRPGSAS